MPNIDDFKSRFRGGARANLYKVFCSFPGYANGNTELTSFMCKAVTIPASVIAPIPVNYQGRIINVAGDRTFEPWTLTIYNDVGYEVRAAFERWMDGMNQHQNNLGLLSPADYKVDMSVQQLDRQENVTREYFIKGAFPTNISQIDLGADANDAVEEFTVELQIDLWTNADTN
jgi:hypothetical protein